MNAGSRTLVLRRLGLQPYTPVWAAMRAFTEAREPGTPSELWLLEHLPVYTLGQGGRIDHVHAVGDFPVVRTDRGGQVTYHGPGQLVAYLLLDLRAAGLGVRPLVTLLESSVVELLTEWGIESAARPDAPGVYVAGRKVASLGLRIRRGCSYHGLALNVDMDLAPFRGIDPCGHRGLEVTQLRALGVPLGVAQAGEALAARLARGLGMVLREAAESGTYTSPTGR